MASCSWLSSTADHHCNSWESPWVLGELPTYAQLCSLLQHYLYSVYYDYAAYVLLRPGGAFTKADVLKKQHFESSILRWQ